MIIGMVGNRIIGRGDLGMEGSIVLRSIRMESGMIRIVLWLGMLIFVRLGGNGVK